jgi:hypothetical protein
MAKALPGKHHRVTATEAAKNFGALVDRVREQRAVYIVERAGQAVAQIAPVASTRVTVEDLRRLLHENGPVDEEYARAVRAGVKALNIPERPRR